MTGFAPDSMVRLTRRDAARIAQRRLMTELDDSLRVQLQRVMPVLIAGFSEWVGNRHPEVWIRWHWYFDESIEQFVVTSHGLQSNLELVDAITGMPIGEESTHRFLLRRIRRRRDWQPWLELKLARQRRAAGDRVAQQDQLVTLPEHMDGTNRWAKEALRVVTDLPDHMQFGAIAKIARERFGFSTTLAVARSRRAPNDMVVDHNHLREWRNVYEAEKLELIDPRIHAISGPASWSARVRREENPVFWDLAFEHGIRAGWAMRSEDGLASLVLSRSDGDISESELSMMSPNLSLLAHAAHALMRRRLAQRAVPPPADPGERALPEHDLEIINHLLRDRGRKEIADLMAISIATLDRRIKAIKHKLGASKLSQVVDIALKMGLLQDYSAPTPRIHRA